MNSIDDLACQKVNLETSKVPWNELQRFFAAGQAVVVANDLDLVQVAYQFSLDNTVKVREWMNEDKLCKVTDLQALKWLEENAQVWAVVIKPWVLVQDSNKG